MDGRREGASMELDRESLKKMFPNLVKDLQADENKVRVNSVRTNQEDGEKAATSQSFDDYMPDVIDFIRRCDTKKQAEEIICYLEKRGEIDKEYAQKLREQLKEKGVRSFGTKKEQDYYLKHSRP
jgi:hypothetical protein